VSATTFPPETQNPTVSITSPTGNQVVFSTTTVTATAADNVGVAQVQFMLDGSNLGAQSTIPPYSTTWNTTQVPDGTHLLTAMARDGAGNSVISAAVAVTVSNSSRRPYITNFPLSQNPISEGGNWINGQTVGLDWANVQTTPGLAFGTQSGSALYNDSTALLAGSWGADQTAQGTVYSVQQTDSSYEEVELRLRSALSAHSATGYEINFRCSKTSHAYAQIVKWNGPPANFSFLITGTGSQYGVANGDVVKATIVDNLITAYINGVQVLQTSDSTYSGGAPGVGFYLSGSTGINSNFGFTNFTASDGSGSDGTPPTVPTNLTGRAVSSSQINLSWTASTDDVGVAGYQVFRNNVQIATSTSTSFSDTALTPNTQYTYALSAFDSAGHTSTQTAPVTVTTPPPDITPPSVPANLQSSKFLDHRLVRIDGRCCGCRVPDIP
jgi:hypothetical protein